MAKRLDKPIRLYVMTIFIVLAYGVIPFVSVLPLGRDLWLFGPRFLPFNGSILMFYGPNGESSPELILISLLLCALSAFSAIVAFAGFRVGRAAALAFVSLNVLWWSFLAIMAFAADEAPMSIALGVLGHVLPPVGWLAMVWWNLTRPELGAWYKQQSELGQ